MPNLRAAALPLSVLSTLAFSFNSMEASTLDLDALHFQRPARTPGTGAPGDRSDGGSRGDCLVAGTALDALVPMEQEDEEIAPNVVIPGPAHVWGNTTSSNPTLWFSLSQPVVSGALEFQLLSADGQKLETYNARLPVMAGAFPIQLSQTTLATGDRYRWTMRIEADCSGDDFQALAVNGWVNRVEMPTEIASSLTGENPAEKATLYAQAGLWYDALAVLMELHQTEPNNPEVASALESLMDQIGLEHPMLSPVFQPTP